MGRQKKHREMVPENDKNNVAYYKKRLQEYVKTKDEEGPSNAANKKKSLDQEKTKDETETRET